MQESYIIWKNKSSKEFGLTCENIVTSQPEQKIKIINTSNKDNNYNYSSKNNKNRPFFENRIITVSAYFKFDSIVDKSNKLSKIMNWLYQYEGTNTLKILPDFSNVIWNNASIENVQTIEVVAMHTVKIIFQFRVDAFSKDTNEQSSESRNIDFTDGKYLMKYNNIGFYNKDFKFILTGACNWTSIKNLLNEKEIYIKEGFRKSCIIDFLNETIIIDDVEIKYDVDYFEMAPGINKFHLESDGEYKIEVSSYNSYLYSYANDEKNSLNISLIEG